MLKFTQKFFAVLLALAMLNLQSYAAPILVSDFSDDASEIVNFDESEIYSQFEELSELTNLVLSENLSANEMLSENSSLLENVELEAMLPVSTDDDGAGGPPLGIPSFLWGCVFGLLGVLLVYLVSDENKDETKKAVWGCVVSGAVSVVYYIIVIAASAASSTSTTY